MELSAGSYDIKLLILPDAHAAPAYDNDRFFLGADDDGRTGRVVALDRNTGEVLWQSPADSLVADSAILTGNLLVVGTEGGDLYGYPSDSTTKAAGKALPVLHVSRFTPHNQANGCSLLINPEDRISDGIRIPDSKAPRWHVHPAHAPSEFD